MILDVNDAALRQLLDRANRGDAAALTELFARYDEPIRRAIAWRLDRRLTARLDVSDVVQETNLEASRRLGEYLRRPEMPFPLWLRWLAREKVLQLHRQHLAEMRTVAREVSALPIDSSAAVVRGLFGREPSPSRAAANAELAERLRLAVGRLDDDERDLILWRHFEQLTNRDIAQMLCVSEAAAAKRYIRALERLRGLLVDQGISGSA